MHLTLVEKGMYVYFHVFTNLQKAIYFNSLIYIMFSLILQLFSAAVKKIIIYSTLHLPACIKHKITRKILQAKAKAKSDRL